MKDPSENRLIEIIKAYWWLPFAILTVGVMFYSVFTAEPLSSFISTAMLVCGILAFVGWLTRNKTTRPEDHSNTLDSSLDSNSGNTVSFEENDGKEDGQN